MTTDSSGECCPKFDPRVWEGKRVTWQDKLFITDNVKQLFHIPLNMGKVVTRMFKSIEDAQASPPKEEFIMLAYDPSPWKSELYMTVTKEVPGAKNVKLSGTYLTQVFDGPYNAVPNWIKEINAYVASKNKKIKKYYFYYTTCPKCAKKYGHNYVVAFTEVE
jgi:hypothetical protein